MSCVIIHESSVSSLNSINSFDIANSVNGVDIIIIIYRITNKHTTNIEKPGQLKNLKII